MLGTLRSHDETRDSRMFGRVIKPGAGVAFAIFAAAAVMIALLLWRVTPAHPARDHDPRLMEIGRTADPIIAALEAYRKERGRFPEPDDPALATKLPKHIRLPHGTFMHNDTPPGWHYAVGPQGADYSLSYKLGWDPSLSYHSRAGETYWEYDPGDGSSPTRLRLDR